MGTHYPVLPITRDRWDAALSPTAYFDSLRFHKEFVRDLYEAARVEREDAELMIGALYAPADVDAAESDRRELFILAATEDWCGDSANVLPYIARLADTIHVPMRIVRRGREKTLSDWYTEQGAEAIPVVSVGAIEGDRFIELTRWVERSQAAHERYEEWKVRNPRFRELLARERDEDEESEFRALYARLMQDMARWYRAEGLWRTIVLELAAALAPGQE
jgi:hypothetical protein